MMRYVKSFLASSLILISLLFLPLMVSAEPMGYADNALFVKFLSGDDLLSPMIANEVAELDYRQPTNEAKTLKAPLSLEGETEGIVASEAMRFGNRHNDIAPQSLECGIFRQSCSNFEVGWRS